MAHIKKWFVYTVFGVAVLVFLVYYLFPSETVARYVASKARELSPALTVSIGQVVPTFPPGLNFAPVRIVYADMLLLESEKIRVFPRIRSVFSPRKTFFLHLDTDDSLLNGRADFSSGGRKRQSAFETAISGTPSTQKPLMRESSDLKISGVLKLDIHWEYRSATGSGIRARIKALNCQLQAHNPLLLQERFIFNRVEAEVYIHGRRVELTEFIFTGDPLDGRIFGYGILQSPLNRSKIELKAQISPHRPFLKPPGDSLPGDIVNMIKSGAGDMSVLIQGTIEKPSFSNF